MSKMVVVSFDQPKAINMFNTIISQDEINNWNDHTTKSKQQNVKVCVEETADLNNCY